MAAPEGCSQRTWEPFVKRISSDVKSSYIKGRELIQEWQQNVFKESSAALLKAGEMEPIFKAEALLFLNMLETALLLLKGHLEDAPHLPLEHQISSIMREIQRDQFLFERTNALQSKMQHIWDSTGQEAETRDKSVLRPRLDMLDVADTKTDNSSKAGDAIYRAPKTFAMPFGNGDDVKRASANERAERLKRSEFVRAVTEKYSDAPLIVGDEDDAIAEMRGIKRSDVKKLKSIQDGSVKATAFSSSTLKNLRRIPELTRLATVGSSLANISNFVDSIGVTAKRDKKLLKRDRKTVGKTGVKRNRVEKNGRPNNKKRRQ